MSDVHDLGLEKGFGACKQFGTMFSVPESSYYCNMPPRSHRTFPNSFCLIAENKMLIQNDFMKKVYFG